MRWRCEQSAPSLYRTLLYRAPSGTHAWSPYSTPNATVISPFSFLTFHTVASSMDSQPPSAHRAVLYPDKGSSMVSTPYSAFIRCCTTAAKNRYKRE